MNIHVLYCIIRFRQLPLKYGEMEEQHLKFIKKMSVCSNIVIFYHRFCKSCRITLNLFYFCSHYFILPHGWDEQWSLQNFLRSAGNSFGHKSFSCLEATCPSHLLVFARRHTSPLTTKANTFHYDFTCNVHFTLCTLMTSNKSHFGTHSSPSISLPPPQPINL